MTVKRSLAIRGHRTSITLEDPFWARLTVVAVNPVIFAMSFRVATSGVSFGMPSEIYEVAAQRSRCPGTLTKRQS